MKTARVKSITSARLWVWGNGPGMMKLSRYAQRTTEARIIHMYRLYTGQGGNS